MSCFIPTYMYEDGMKKQVDNGITIEVTCRDPTTLPVDKLLALRHWMCVLRPIATVCLPWINNLFL